MALIDRVFALTIMALILLFSLIHLGVSIGLIVKDRKYADFFRPQIGLSSFNLVIFIFSFITGILGITALALNSERFGKINHYDSRKSTKSIFHLARIVCIVSGVVGIFALASLVAAIVISDKSPNYVHTRFLNGQNKYKTDAAVRDRIDLLQTKYDCCGNDIWIDWANANLNGTSTDTNVTNTTAVTSTTTVSSTTTNANTTVTTSTTTTSVVSSTNSTSKKKRDLFDSVEHSIKERQVISNYGDISGLPISFGVVLPSSCCLSQATLTSNDSDACMLFFLKFNRANNFSCFLSLYFKSKRC